METKMETASCVYDEHGNLIAIVKRDDKSRKSLVYLTEEADVEAISSLISGNTK